MSCNGICNRFEGYCGNPKFSLGHRYCRNCGYSFLIEGLQCPCCNQFLRRTARHKKKSDFNDKF